MHICGRGFKFVSFYDFSTGFLEMFQQCDILYLEMFQQCGILEMFQQCGIL
jgi:hypothetical protein